MSIIKNFFNRIGRYISDNFFNFIISMSVLIFIAYPVVCVILKSVFEKGRFTLKYYGYLLNSDMFTVTSQSIALAIASSLICTVLAYILTLAIYLSSQKIYDFFKKLLLFTIISPPFVTSIAMILLFGRRGFITYQLLNLKLNIYGWRGILFIQILSGLSFAILILSNSFDRIDTDIILASSDLGANTVSTLKNIIFPSTKAGFLSVFFVLFTMNFADFATPVIIGGRFLTLATHAYNSITATGDLYVGSAISVVMVIPSIFAFIFYQKMMKNSIYVSDDTHIKRINEVIKPPIYMKIILNISLILFALYNFLKYITIFLSAITNNKGGNLTFTLNNFYKLDSLSINSFLRSIVYSFAASIIAVVVGTFISYMIYRAYKENLKIIELISSLPYVIPGTFFGLAYLIAFSRKPIQITNTAIIIILNLAFRQICVSNKSANSIYPNIDRKLEYAAKDLGADRFTLLKTVIIPISKPVFANSFAQIFTSSMTAFGSVIFLVSPGKFLASTEMFRQIKGGGNAVGSILAIFIILVTGFVNILSSKFLKDRW